MASNNETLLSNLASSSTSLFNNNNMNNMNNNNNANQNIKKINEIINDKKQMRSSSVGHFNLDMVKQNQNSKKNKYIEYNSNKLNNNINLLSNLSNINNTGNLTNLFNIGSLSSLSGEQTQMRNFKENFLENNNNYNINSQRIKMSNLENKNKNIIKMNGSSSKVGFYLPQLNNGKTINHNDLGNNSNLKLKNKLNISQFKFKINHGNKKGLNVNNKLLIIPGNNYQPIFKRSESTGFINFGTNINSNKSNRANRNNYTKKNFIGLSGLINNGYNNYNEKKLYRNASDLFH